MLAALRHALRALARAKGFTVVAALTLALGVGATTAIYTLLDAVVLRPLPYPAPERLAVVEHAVPGVKADARWNLAKSNYFYYGRESRTIEALGLYRGDASSVRGTEGAEQRPAARVTPNLLTAVLRLRPAAGRLFGDADSRPGAEPLVVIGDALWAERFGRDPRAVGQVLGVDGVPRTIVGVLAPGAVLGDRTVDVWMPIELDPTAPAANNHVFAAIARLRPGATAADAARDLAPLTARLPELYPQAYSPNFMRSTGFRPVVTPLLESVVGSVARALWILLGAVSLLLVIACANVANLLLVRAEGRRREVALRVALGAGRAQLARQFLAEGLVLATIAAAAGLALAWGALWVVPRLAPVGLPRLADVGLGWRAAAFAAAVALGSAIVLSLLPLLRAGTSAGALRDGGRGATAGRGRQLVRHGLVVGQVALALVLLTGAGLLLESFRRLRNVRPGLEPAGVVAFDVALPYARYDSYETTAAFYRGFLEQLAALPGVQQAASTTWLPLDHDYGCSAVAVSDKVVARGEEAACVPTIQVSPGYFRTMGITLQGAAPDWSETERGLAGAVVSRALAERFWPGEDPIGKGIKGNGNEPPYYRIVGVTGDVRAEGLDKAPTEVVYFPMMPATGTVLWSPPNYMTVVLRTRSTTPEALTGAVRRTLAQLDPEVPLANVRTMDDVVAKSTARVSFTMTLLGTASLMALVLSAVGLYGVLAYVVWLRTHEIGVRIALGARGSQVRRLVVLQSARLAALGLALGLAGALAAGGVLRAFLFEVRPAEPLVLGATATLLAAVALLASYVPARRATRVDPMTALRAD